MCVERLVDDAPGVVGPDERQVVAVPDACELAPEPDQGRAALDREALDSPLIGPRLCDCPLALGHEFFEGRPGQLAPLVADDGRPRMECAAELRRVALDPPAVL